MGNLPMMLDKLLSVGICVAVKQGRLTATYLNGQAKELTPDEVRTVLKEIGKLTPAIMMTYLGYDTGNYLIGQGKRRPSLRLEFCPFANCPKDPISFFNVVLTRDRAHSGGHAKGDPLPKGHFSVSRRHDFYKLWDNCGLPNGFSPTKYHERMGKLKGIIFTGVRNEKKLNKINDVSPLELSLDDIRRLVATHKERTNSTQIAHNYRIRTAHKESGESPYWQGSQPD